MGRDSGEGEGEFLGSFVRSADSEHACCRKRLCLLCNPGSAPGQRCNLVRAGTKSASRPHLVALQRIAPWDSLRGGPGMTQHMAHGKGTILQQGGNKITKRIPLFCVGCEQAETQ
eukprot:365754-Chlamydomonas_euryale.AAC.6